MAAADSQPEEIRERGGFAEVGDTGLIVLANKSTSNWGLAVLAGILVRSSENLQ